MPPATASDGQRLEDQSADVQNAYRAVYGADAEAKWIAEHNEELHYYHRIVAVAKARIARLMDMDQDMDMAMGLPYRIAADVIA